MRGKVQLSNALRITDVNDFLSPSAACVLPLGGGALREEPNSNSVAKLKAEPAGSVLAPIVPTKANVTGNAKAKVTVSDCLACSGCVTSAETVLLSTESVDNFKKFMLQSNSARSRRYTVIALSQQSVSSIGVHYGMGLTTTARKLTTFLKKHVGFDVVVDLSFPRHLALLQAREEFLERYHRGKKLTISSACPGWVTYAEKTQDSNILEYISTVRSPQGILGAVAEYLRPANDHRPVWVSAVMMCHDKKLEASRPEFIKQLEGESDAKEVDCVLTTGELVDLIQERNFDLRGAEETSLDTAQGASLSDEFGVRVSSGSGGYAEFVLRAAAKELLGVCLPSAPLVFEKASKSGDLRTFTVSNADGSRELRFATAYGFRCLQSVLRKMRRGECAYNYIELMACPGGCNNGGGQLPLPNNPDGDMKSLKQQATNHLQQVENTFNQAPNVADPLEVPSVQKVYKDMLGGYPGSVESKKKLTMPIVSRQSTTMSSLSW